MLKWNNQLILEKVLGKSVINKTTRMLITGGTGSFGVAFVEEILRLVPDIERLVIFSRDELKQYEMSQRFSPKDHPGIRYFLGDVRDKSRLKFALEGVDLVVHAAALKQVPAAEYNPFEYIQTNVLGAQNLIEACLEMAVKKVVALSTDKACEPANLYGATKLCSDKLFAAANNFSGRERTCFSIVRYGNVFGSRGSVAPLFLGLPSDHPFPITDKAMTRFSVSLNDAVGEVLWAEHHMEGGEIFVPKIPSYRLTDLAQAIDPYREINLMGIRPGEKIHEVMISRGDSGNVYDLGERYVVCPVLHQQRFESLLSRLNLGLEESRVSSDFEYSSGSNSHFLSTRELGDLVYDLRKQCNES